VVEALAAAAPPYAAVVRSARSQIALTASGIFIQRFLAAKTSAPKSVTVSALIATI